MTTQTDNLLPRHTIVVIAANALALLAFVLSPFGAEYPLLAAGIVAVVLVQAFVPACRVRADIPLCPANIAQGIYWVQFVLVALLIGYFGVSQGTLPYLPGKDAFNTALLIHIAGYLSFCGACQWCYRDDAKQTHQLTAPTPEWFGTAYLILPFVLFGIVGLVLIYGSVAGFIEYASTPSAHRAQTTEPTQPEGAAASFLRHFLGFAIVLAWSWWIGRTQQPRSKVIVGVVTVGVALLMMFANFSFNRGTMLGPVLALAAAFSIHVWPIPFKSVAIAGGVVLVAAFSFGAYRSSTQEASEMSAAQISESLEVDSLVDFVQVYANAPQLPAYYLEQLDQEGKFFYGATIFPSIVYPIPVLGKPHREMSGVYLFNEAIYGDPEVLDQIIPLDAELYMNFHIPGVIFGNLLLGAVICFYQRKFMNAANAAESYAWCMFALWTVFPGSLPVISQIFVYSFWPIYIYLFAKKHWPSRNAMVPIERRGAAVPV
jgi:O-antigen polysaccharide polymerase Wzy